MAKVQVKLQWMNGEGLSPGAINEYIIPDDELTVITEIVQVGRGKFTVRQQNVDIESEDASDGVLAKISKRKASVEHVSNFISTLTSFLEPVTLSLMLEPLVRGVSVELPPSSKCARLFDSDRISVPQSRGRERHYTHLRPEDTINFSQQGLKVAIMTEIPDSSPPPSSGVEQNDFITASEQVMHSASAEIQVKSSNVEQGMATVGDDEDMSDPSDEDLDQPLTERSAKTPAANELTPATSRPTEPTIMETPHERGELKGNEDHPQENSDNDEPYSTARDAPTGNALAANEPNQYIADSDSPTVQRKMKLTARFNRVARDSSAAPSEADPNPTSTVEDSPDADPTSTIEGTSASDNEAEKEVFKTPVKTTYGRQRAKGTLPRASQKSRRIATAPAKLPDDDFHDPDIANATDGEPGKSPIITGTSEPLDSGDMAFEAAGRTVPGWSGKRRISEEEDEGAGMVVSKKRKTRSSKAVSEDKQADRENLEIPEATAPQDSTPEEMATKVAKPAQAAKKGRGPKPQLRQTQESADEVVVAQPSVSSKKGRKSSSPIVVVHTQRASKRLIRASETPSSSATSSVLTGKVPSILLSSESALRKSCGKWLKQQGATMIDDVKARRANFVCVVKDDKHKLTTAKVLRSLALGKLVVTEKWITESKKAGQLLEPDEFVHPKVKHTISDDRRSMFEGMNLFFTKTLVNDVYKAGWDDIQALAKEAGASHVEKIESGTFGQLKGSLRIVCFGHDKDDVDLPRLIGQQGCTIYHKDFLTHSIIAGELDLDDEEYKLSAGATME